MLRKKKRILLSIDWFLPGYRMGGPVQSCANLIAHFKEEYEFWVITRNTDYCSDIPYANIQADTWVKMEEQVNIFYFSSKNLSAFNLYKTIREVKADIAYINGIYSPFFSIMPLIILKAIGHSNIIVSGRGMFAPGSVNVKARKKKLFFRFAKSLKLFNKVIFHATNESEKEYIERILGKSTVRIAPNLPKSIKSSSLTVRNKDSGFLKLISIARISPEKNTKFALEILSKYKGTGKIEFKIFGPIYNEEYWLECQQVIKDMPTNVEVSYHGSLDSNLVSETLKEHHALFLPTRGENFGHIILESFTAGCPVIISDQTPWRNLQELGIGYDLPLHNTNAFLKVIEDLTQTEAESFLTLSHNAFNFAKTYIEDPAAVEANQQLFQL